MRRDVSLSASEYNIHLSHSFCGHCITILFLKANSMVVVFRCNTMTLLRLHLLNTYIWTHFFVKITHMDTFQLSPVSVRNDYLIWFPRDWSSFYLVSKKAEVDSLLSTYKIRRGRRAAAPRGPVPCSLHLTLHFVLPTLFGSCLVFWMVPTVICDW